MQNCHKNIRKNELKNTFKKITQNDQVGFIMGTQGWFNTCNSINLVQHSNRMKNKTYMISTDAKII